MAFSKYIPSFSFRKKFKEHIIESNKLEDGPPARYQLNAQRVNQDGKSDEESKFRKFILGKMNTKYQNRTILLVGATGSGKSTLINALVNYVMGVKFEDKVCFDIILSENDRPQSDSQTSEVSVYEVYGFEGERAPYSLTIVDTPGYGDTRGHEHDEIITKQLQDLFCAPDGVNVISVVGLVLKATENRLDERMAYIFNSVTSLFAKNIETRIVAMMTHSDGMKPKNALQALDDAKIKCARSENNEPIYFMFNNCQKENRKNERAAKNAFETSQEGFKVFTDFVEKCEPQTLTTTAEVLKERERLTACVENIKSRVEHIEIMQKTIEQNKAVFLQKAQEMINLKSTVEVSETYKEKVKIDNWWDSKAVCCLKCQENCHYPGCTWALSPSWCSVMKDGRCTSCSGKCPVEDHVKENWRYVTKTRTVTKTSEEIMAKYEIIKCESREQTTLLKAMEKEMADLQQTKQLDLNEAFLLIEQLDKNALNVNSVSTYEHLDYLIQKMKEKMDTQKVQKLEQMRDRMDEKNKAGADYLMKCRQNK